MFVKIITMQNHTIKTTVLMGETGVGTTLKNFIRNTKKERSLIKTIT